MGHTELEEVIALLGLEKSVWDFLKDAPSGDACLDRWPT